MTQHAVAGFAEGGRRPQPTDAGRLRRLQKARKVIPAEFPCGPVVTTWHFSLPWALAYRTRGEYISIVLSLRANGTW